MPLPDDPSDGPSTLPQPDLNPLLNPLLGQNMGRWAEVYFTSLPEKREQAVLDLLRELQEENAARAVASPLPLPARAAQPVAAIPGVRMALAPCPACGRENPASHRFCGMCGWALAEDGADADVHMADPHTAGLRIADPHIPDQIADLHIADLHIPDLSVPDFGVADFNPDGLAAALESAEVDVVSAQDRRIEHPHPAEPVSPAPGKMPGNGSNERIDNDSGFAPLASTFHEPGLQGDDLPRPEVRHPEIGHEVRHKADSDAYGPNGVLDPARVTRPYRAYIGIGLALVIAVLGYMAWRSAQAPPTIVTRTAAQSPASTQNSPTSSTNPQNGSSPAGQQPVVPSHNATKQVSPGANAELDPASRAVSANLPPRKNLQEGLLAGSGGQELAMAQRYLNGTNGRQRDSVEAAKWLWKAVAKHNGEATMLLSDLYLKGDGVSKNCDQARVLLDAAVIRGVKGAAERLRNLQAFGCS